MSFMSPFLLTPCPLSLPPSPPQNAHACLSAWMQGSGLSEGTAYTFAFRVTNPTNAQSSPPVPALSLLCVSGVCVFLMGAHVCVCTLHTHTHTHARARTHTHTLACAYCPCLYIHACVHAYNVCQYIHACAHAYTVYTCMHTTQVNIQATVYAGGAAITSISLSPMVLCFLSLSVAHPIPHPPPSSPSFLPPP